MKKSVDPIHFTIMEEFFVSKPSKSERRRLQIIEQTIVELATVGLDATTHETLAEACGISRALVQHYFPDRDELFLIAFRFCRARFQKLCVDKMEKEKTTEGKLRVYVYTACSWIKLLPYDAKVWTLFYYHCAIQKKYRKLNTELVEQGHARIAAMLAGQKLKAPLIQAKMIQNAITGFYIASTTEDPEARFYQELLESTVDQCMQLAGFL